MVLPLLTGLGLGFTGLGAISNYQASKQSANLNRQSSEESRKQAQLEQQVERQRKVSMEVDARRKRMEVLRNQQRARSTALAVSNAQGANFGSALAGAYGQIGGQTGTNLRGIDSNLDIGRNIFDYNSLISQSKMRQFELQGQMGDASTKAALGQGLTSLGGSTLGLMDPINRLGKNMFGSSV